MYRYAKIVLMALAVFMLVAAGADLMYVQSKKAKVLKSPSFRAKVVVTASKGDALEIVDKKGKWFKVNVNGKTGWVSRLLVSKRPPIKKVSVFAKAGPDISSKARRRASVMTTAAAARGLAEDDRRRLGTSNKMDYAAVEKMEAITITESEVEAFLDQAR